MKRLSLFFVIIVLLLPLSAQEAGNSGDGFSAGLNLGSDLLPDPNDPTVITSWSKLGFQPDLAMGKLGIGLDLTFRFKLYPDGSTPFVLYTPDWIPMNGQTVFDVYLPKIMYLRYGKRGIDPLYVKLGSISDFGLANGLIVSDYANTKFLPQTRLFGLQAGVDGALFKVPYFGVEALTGNLANLDVIGGRVYIRPLAFMDASILGRIQIGGTAVVDRDPLIYTTDAEIIASSYPATKLIYVYGADVTVPVVTGDVFSLTAFVEGAREMNGAMGAITGVGGKLIGFISYGAQIRYLQEGFIPTYFDNNYDLYRAERFDYIESTVPGNFTAGWLANLGFDLFNKKLQFSALLDGPFAPIPVTASDNSAAYPHLKGRLSLGEGMIGGLSFDGSYEKYFLGRQAPFFEDLIDPMDAAIGFGVNYKTGATVLTLAYRYSWNPSKVNDDSTVGGFDVSSSLSASVRF
ncbi:MAG TPA: hypothetical protein VN445_06255 [Rectinemataceae bacterium]|nr:hypothetical protein [Rectinemataceae bacterium]